MTYSSYPRRPIKSFQDLEVYQKTLGISVAVVKRISVETLCHCEPACRQAGVSEAISTELQHPNGIAASSTAPRNDIDNITANLHECVLSLPILIATAHSVRFSNPHEAINNLEKAMLNINLTIVYLEQFRDIVNNNIETEFFQEQIKNLIQSRSKILHLQMSWKQFMKNYGQKETGGKNHE